LWGAVVQAVAVPTVCGPRRSTNSWQQSWQTVPNKILMYRQKVMGRADVFDMQPAYKGKVEKCAAELKGAIYGTRR